LNKNLFALVLLLAIGALTVWIYLSLGNPDANIVAQVRLPRLLLTLYTGMVLAGIGSVYQLMLANPLAEPYILGISSGAAFGSILLGVLGFALLMPVGGFIGAAATLLIVWALARRKGSFDRSRLIIAGVITGMFFSAGISLIMYLFQKDTMIILGTLMGNLGRVFTHSEWRSFLVLATVSAVLLAWLYLKSSALDIMSGGDVYAGSVGIDVPRVRKQIFLISSVLIGITVSYAGIIGFVGLIMPHLVRFFIPSGQRRVFVFSLFAGGIFLLACDLAARHSAVIELPVGVVTAAVGCPFFMWMMMRKG
jgi:iron complex transport system permease protein